MTARALCAAKAFRGWLCYVCERGSQIPITDDEDDFYIFLKMCSITQEKIRGGFGYQK